ncbi:MAG: undecaprenyl-diphosphate phosphatase [Hyphomonadaceae bacterium]
MSLTQLILLAIVQGITEWLPISSSAHLILLPELLGSGQQGLLIDAMAHLGTLGSLLIYFRKDVGRAIKGGFELIGIGKPDGPMSPAARLAWFIIIATPPGIVAGLALQMAPESLQTTLRSPLTIAFTSIIFGLLLWWADVKGKRTRTQSDMTWRDAGLIGLSQMLPFIPGVSRSGITMTTSRMLGFERTEAARFAMLVGAPLIAGVGLYAFYGLATGDPAGASLKDGLIVAALSFVTGYVSIWGLMSLLKRMSFLPFVIYRVLLGLVILATSPAILTLFS